MEEWILQFTHKKINKSLCQELTLNSTWKKINELEK